MSDNPIPSPNAPQPLARSIQHAWRLIRFQWRPLLVVVLLSFLSQTLYRQIWPHTLENGILKALLSLVHTAVYIWLWITQLLLLDAARKRFPLPCGRALRETRRYFLRVLGIDILVWGLCLLQFTCATTPLLVVLMLLKVSTPVALTAYGMLGLLLCLVILTIFAFSPYLVLLDNKSIREALGESGPLTAGRRIDLALLMVAIFVASYTLGLPFLDSPAYQGFLRDQIVLRHLIVTVQNILSIAFTTLFYVYYIDARNKTVEEPQLSEQAEG